MNRDYFACDCGHEWTGNGGGRLSATCPVCRHPHVPVLAAAPSDDEPVGESLGAAGESGDLEEDLEP